MNSNVIGNTCMLYKTYIILLTNMCMNVKFLFSIQNIRFENKIEVDILFNIQDVPN